MRALEIFLGIIAVLASVFAAVMLVLGVALWAGARARARRRRGLVHVMEPRQWWGRR